MWKIAYGNLRSFGIVLEGDKSVPRTRWWNERFLIRWWWKTITILEVSAEDALRGYGIGFVPQKGEPKITEKSVHHTRFCVRNGHEDCRFFAVQNGEEIPLTVIARTKKDDPRYADVPVY